MKIAFTESAWKDYIWNPGTRSEVAQTNQPANKRRHPHRLKELANPNRSGVIYLAAGREGLRTNTALFIKQRPPN